jgi:mRNA-degrading endonuclease RelE of RelBE toxin-antitoxin system
MNHVLLSAEAGQKYRALAPHDRELLRFTMERLEQDPLQDAIRAGGVPGSPDVYLIARGLFRILYSLVPGKQEIVILDILTKSELRQGIHWA